ncbi:hypothetical protein YC2023_018219 [Brassica napus]
MREVVCHVLDHLREEGPQTTMRRLETVKVLHLLGAGLLRLTPSVGSPTYYDLDFFYSTALVDE